MKSCVGKTLLIVTLGLFAHVAQAQRSAETHPAVSDVCALANSASAATVHAPQRGTSTLSLCDGHGISGNAAQTGLSTPLALASGDFDEDGVPDLVSGFGEGKAGAITVHRGNVAALWPYGAALRNGPPPAFFPNARRFSLPETPDLIVTGDLTQMAIGISSLPSTEATRSIFSKAMAAEASAPPSVFPSMATSPP